MRNPELEEQIRKNPDDPAAYLVYADWLTEVGDPHGELIAVQNKLREARALSDREQQILGGLALPPLRGATTEIDWFMGFARRVRVGIAGQPAGTATDSVADTLPALLAHPMLSVLQDLSFEVTSGWGYLNVDFEPIAEALPRCETIDGLRSLSFVEKGAGAGARSPTSISVGDLEPVIGRLPGLRTLRVHGRANLGPALRLSELEVLEIESARLEREMVCDVMANEWPQLHTLSIWFPDPDTVLTATVDDLEPLLQANAFPKLKHLAIRSCSFGVDLCQALAHAPLLPRLDTLELTHRTVTAAAAQELLTQRGAFMHLTQLDLRYNHLPGDLSDELGEVAAHTDVPTGDPALSCSFCGLSQREVRRLIAGPQVFICDQCIALCNDIVAEEENA